MEFPFRCYANLYDVNVGTTPNGEDSVRVNIFPIRLMLTMTLTLTASLLNTSGSRREEPNPLTFATLEAVDFKAFRSDIAGLLIFQHNDLPHCE